MGYSALVILSGNASSGIDQWNLRLKDFISLLKVGNLNIVESCRMLTLTVLPSRPGAIRNLLLLY